MGCPDGIVNALQQREGTHSIDFNIATRRFTLNYNPEKTGISDIIRHIEAVNGKYRIDEIREVQGD